MKGHGDAADAAMRPSWLFRQAEDRFREGDDEEAALLFRQIAETGSEEAERARDFLKKISERADELPYAKGLHFAALGDEEEAIRHFERAAEMAGSRRSEANAQADRMRARLRGKIAEFSHVQPKLSERSETRDDGRSVGSRRPSIPPFRMPSTDAPAGRARPSPHGPATVAPVLRRTPHLDIVADRIEPGALLTVNVYADTTAQHDGERSEGFNLTGDRCVVDVRLLTSEHFELRSGAEGRFRIDASKDTSSVATFRVAIKPAAALAPLAATPAALTAVLTSEQRPAGKVCRFVAIGAESREAPLITTPMTVEPGTQRADLTITIVAKPINDGRQFWCIVRSPLLPEYANGVTGDWNLKDVSRTIVGTFMQDFTEQTDKAQLVAALKGAGRNFFKASPPVFQQIFWKLMDRPKSQRINQPLRSISIVSDEPFIPWELMVPNRQLGGVMDKQKPLGTEFRIGRWTTTAAAPQRITVSDGYVIAPEYEGTRALPFAQDEARELNQQFGATAIKPATFGNFSTALRAGGRTLIHFACHGADDDTDQAIYLEGDVALKSSTFEGMDAADDAFAAARPFVFLNACEVGRPKAALVGIGGFAPVFVAKGASAVVAPLWSVKDNIAHEIAQAIYREIDTVPVAEILRRVRTKAYDEAVAEDSYAAYCFYGDPDAMRTVDRDDAGGR